MKMQTDQNKYTLQRLGQIFDLRAAEDVQMATAQAFYEAVDMSDDQVAMLQKYMSLVIDTQSECSWVLRKDTLDCIKLKSLSEKEDTAKQDFLSSVSLEKEHRDLFDRYAHTTRIVQKLYMEAILDGINPLHWHSVKVPSFKEVMKRLRRTDEWRLTQQELGEELCISQTHVSAIERGEENPSLSVVKLMSHEFDISFDFLKATLEVV